MPANTHTTSVLQWGGSFPQHPRIHIYMQACKRARSTQINTSTIAHALHTRTHIYTRTYTRAHTHPTNIHTHHTHTHTQRHTRHCYAHTEVQSQWSRPRPRSEATGDFRMTGACESHGGRVYKRGPDTVFGRWQQHGRPRRAGHWGPRIWQ